VIVIYKGFIISINNKMTIYRLTNKQLRVYKNRYGDNVCGANSLDLLGFDRSVIEQLLNYKNIDFEWNDMLEVIQNDDSKIKNKKYIKNGVETSMNILPFNRNDYNSNISYIEFITDELIDGTYKIIGITGLYETDSDSDMEDETWGHYMIIGKNNKGEILTFDPPTYRFVIGIDNIIQDFSEDNVNFIINYNNGLIVNRRLFTSTKKTKRKKNKHKRNTKYRKI